jgi:hypothetical protein
MRAIRRKAATVTQVSSLLGEKGVMRGSAGGVGDML